MNIIIALLVLSFIIIIHELGHFLLAKKNGIGVTEFSVGMGPRILSTVRKDTRYSLKLFPIGGSCMMVGEDEDCDDDSAFNNHSVWSRISVIAAGPIFNLILAFLFAWIIIGFVGYDKPIVVNVMEGSPAEAVGIEAGDTIVKINNKKINIYKEVSIYLSFHPGETINLVYERDGVQHETVIEPMYDEESGRYLMGFLGSGIREKGNPLQNVKYAGAEMKYWVNTTFSTLKMLVTGNVQMDDVSGPVGIVNMIGETVEESKSDGLYYVMLNLMNITVLLSSNLAIMNLLPIPALDGGRLVFLILEAVRRKKIPPEKEGYVHLAGMALLMIFMVVILFNDIKNIFL